MQLQSYKYFSLSSKRVSIQEKTEIDICNNLFLDRGLKDAILLLDIAVGQLFRRRKFAVCCLEITVPGPGSGGSKADIARSLPCLTSLPTTHSITKISLTINFSQEGAYGLYKCLLRTMFLKFRSALDVLRNVVNLAE